MARLKTLKFKFSGLSIPEIKIDNNIKINTPDSENVMGLYFFNRPTSGSLARKVPTN